MARRSNPGGSSPSLNRELVTAAATRSEPANRRLTGDSSETPTWPPARVRVSSPARDQTSINGPAWTRTAGPGPVRPSSSATSGATSNTSSASLRMAPTLLFSAIRSAPARDAHPEAQSPEPPVHPEPDARRVVRTEGGGIGPAIARDAVVVGRRGLDREAPLPGEPRLGGEHEADQQQAGMARGHFISRVIHPVVAFCSPFTIQLNPG